MIQKVNLASSCYDNLTNTTEITNTIHNSTKRGNNHITDRHSSISINKVSNLDKIITTNDITRVKTIQD